MGGIGKTTVAQLVFNDDRLKDTFDVMSWVCVSDTFVTRMIVECVTRSTCNLDNLELLQAKLSDLLRNKRFLIILDDAWSYEHWELLRAPFIVGAHGSKIITTTRIMDVSSSMRASPVNELRPLTDEEGWSLLSRHALSHGGRNTHPELIDVGRKIVRKCQGLPLSIKTVGAVLRSSADVKVWEDILKSSIWDLPPAGEVIIPTLRLSYYHLSPQHKRCFAYCAIFLKGHVFERESLVRLWMAENFVILEPCSSRGLEDVADEYFDCLLSRSFFQPALRYGTSGYVMHDLFHDLAELVSGNSCFLLEGNKELNLHRHARHMSYDAKSRNNFYRLEEVPAMKQLRTFFAFSQESLPVEAPLYISPQFHFVRVLSLAVYNGCELPCTIGNLKYLRYLDVSRSAIVELPESICTLYNLQTLLLFRCRRLEVLPKDMWKLISLRHLDISYTKVRRMPEHMGRLKNLRTLTKFIVDRDTRSTLRDLKSLEHLVGDLSLEGLQNIASADDAGAANLTQKKFLRKLRLVFGDCTIDSQIERNVLESLQPSSQIEGLEISKYGTSFQSWLMGDLPFAKMVNLRLSDCKNCISLPQLGQLACLRSLIISGMEYLHKIGVELYGRRSPFPSLEEMSLGSLKSWELWEPSGTGVIDFPRLEVLRLRDCPKLKGVLPIQFPSLKTLELVGCEQLLNNLDQRFSAHDETLTSLASLKLQSLGRIPLQLIGLSSLKSLEIQLCPEFKQLPDLLSPNLNKLLLCGSGLESLPKSLVETSLKRMGIGCCRSLKLCPDDELPVSLSSLVVMDAWILEVGMPWTKMQHFFSSLVVLHLHNVVGLVSFPLGSFPNLRYIDLKRCEDLESISMLEEGVDERGGLTCLYSLDVYRCPKLVEFVGREEGLVIPNLRVLRIWDCMKLKSLPRGMLDHSTSLTSLVILWCPSLELIPEAILPPSLIFLCMDHFDRLTSHWSDRRCLQATCPHLKDLCIGLETGECFPEKENSLPTGLTLLSIFDCDSLKKLDGKGLQNLTSLEYLIIMKCSQLQSLPEEGLPSSVSRLKILDCPNLEASCRREGGKDWPKIAHIPWIKFKDVKFDPDKPDG